MYGLFIPLIIGIGISTSSPMYISTPPKEISIYDVKEEIEPITNPLAITYEYRQKIKIVASAYTSSLEECGKTNGITASGLKASYSRGTIAVPRDVPFGTRINIPVLNKTFISEDRGSTKHIKWIDKYTMRIDIFMESKKEAIKFGRKNLEGYIYKKHE